MSYSTPTHHTRLGGAIGLHFILILSIGDEAIGLQIPVLRIIASVYDKMEETGKRKEFLFLDEINCIIRGLLAPQCCSFFK